MNHPETMLRLVRDRQETLAKEAISRGYNVRRVEERATYHFYLAKLYAKGGRNELAMQYLRKALEEGFKEKKKLEEPEFAALRELPEYKELMAKEQRVL